MSCYGDYESPRSRLAENLVELSVQNDTVDLAEPLLRDDALILEVLEDTVGLDLVEVGKMR